jgi:alkanesulfonate monooxygenase SsuD/methylene tetrahydromethanopterin reductase-like flavin-dependent oxidoreductase (luciferase family)
VQDPRPEIIIGGTGPRRTPLAAARFADEFNSGSAQGCAERFANVRRVCEEIGRDPSTLRMSVTAQVICGASRAEAAKRLERLGPPGERMLANGVVGEPAEVVDALGALAAEGCEIAYLHIFDIDDLDHLRLLGAEVLPHVA